jgi:subtilisin family serine protease
MSAVAVTNPALDLVGLTSLMSLSSGSQAIPIGLIDGPVVASHPDLRNAALVQVGDSAPTCQLADSGACAHGTFIAGILAAHRASSAPAICPDSPLLVRPVFAEVAADGGPLAAPAEVAAAIADCVDAGARLVNLSAAVGYPSVRMEVLLRQALDFASKRGVLVVAAAGNQGTVGTSEITRHPGVLPVVAYDDSGRPLAHSNLGRSLGLRGVGAPGRTTSLSPDGSTSVQSGTSVATAFVSGAAALLLALAAGARSSDLVHALVGGVRRRSVTPPLLDAATAYRQLVGSRPDPTRHHF